MRLARGPRTVVVAGDDAGPPARLLAQRANWPLLAEPTSGSRTGTHAIRTYRLLLETALAERIERVVVTGHPTLSRPVTAADLAARHRGRVRRGTGRRGDRPRPRRPAPAASMPVVEGATRESWMDEWRAPMPPA